MGRLLLLPNLLYPGASAAAFLPAALAQKIETLDGIFCESEKEARRYLRLFVSHEAMQKIALTPFNEHTEKTPALLDPVVRGETWGILSDAGLACIADPGTELVFWAHQKKIPVEPIAGPSALLFALQMSGFSGQQFSFHGYLPREEEPLEKKVLLLEKRASEETQIWIEAPYRTEKMRQFLLRVLQPDTLLCIASSLTAPEERVITLPVDKWRSISPPFQKEPAVFLMKRA